MRKYAIGVLIGFLLAFSTNAFAAVGDKVEAVFAEFGYVVNGESQTLESPVLVHDGNSYLRTTQVANLLGYDVTYKADSRTIEFNGSLPPAPSVEPSITPEEPLERSEGTLEIPIDSPATSGIEGLTEPSAEPTPSPEPDNTAACQAIRDDYAGQIAMLAYGPKNDLGHIRFYTLQLEYARDQALSASGC